jgi:alpha-mannosidase
MNIPLMKNRFLAFSVIAAMLWGKSAAAQPVYFADGQHGGVYGHYPLWVTQFLVDKLNQNPDWKINLEIEPETWDTVQSNTPEAYNAFKTLFADQSVNGRLEYVNPQYGQSFLWNVTGESVIRQFDYGIRKLKDHFPNVELTAYSSEEPMFTSALPGILESFGFKYAVLKNPDTCWGGYTRAYGGELLNWVGPDGSKIITVPRYAIESLQPGSTWQTIAWNNSTEYINAAFTAGISHPIGMCFQDAGWRNGPWLGDGKRPSHPVIYETWHGYFENISIKEPPQDWSFSQEDLLVSLVWGSQVLQQIAQQARSAENRIVMAEKLAAMAKVYAAMTWPKASLDEAWRTLLLSEHHDCWIVPYNLKDGSTWAEHVTNWTSKTRQTSDDLIQQSINTLSGRAETKGQSYARVFNASGSERSAITSVELPDNWGAVTRILDRENKEIPSQIALRAGSNVREVIFRADVPAVGYNTYQMQRSAAASATGAGVSVQAGGTFKLETDLYRIILDPARGGAMKSLVAKQLENKEFVDTANARSFGEIRGYFYNAGGFHSSTESPAEISILENGPIRVRVAIRGMVNLHPFVQVITAAQGQRAIDLDLHIAWNGNPGIGAEYAQSTPWRDKDNTRAFYDDRYKLLVLFPLNLGSQKVWKNAPFDVTQSKLTDTFFTTWDGIKNNVILNWVDVMDASNSFGLALLTDHTTSYVHGADHPLGLTLQYSGVGLWGKHYAITGPTDVHYALIPHAGSWDRAGIWTESDNWNAPLAATRMNADPKPADYRKSLMDVTGTGLEVSAVLFQGNDLFVRIFNAEGDTAPKQLCYNGKADKVQLVDLDGRVAGDLNASKGKSGGSMITLTLPRFGIKTIKFHDAHD